MSHNVEAQYEIEALPTGSSIMMDGLDWYHLLHLAARYGWRAQEDLSYYLNASSAISRAEAEQMAATL